MIDAPAARPYRLSPNEKQSQTQWVHPRARRLASIDGGHYLQSGPQRFLLFSPKLSTAFIASYRHPLQSGELLLSLEQIGQAKQYSDIDNIEKVAQKA
ncbi:hypothetical protein [Microbulbifer guangxiensis]|uniref:hypothetical protein n=1 Tax=Microbulbifer guangxiensis TaxID=2904249 RepID=UPI001F26D6AD|nr:hypothetical protein [Microbulbifer guangxiensis]